MINGGGIPQSNPVLSQVYASSLRLPILVPSRKITGLGSAIFAFFAAAAFRSIEEGQDQICPFYTESSPQSQARQTYNETTSPRSFASSILNPHNRFKMAASSRCCPN
jgi:L-ribulokinase